ncbi:hypothetical protein BE17_15250 [Sorangium cellulosum]|uniref:Uncharacterized protein n=1 Tax=Sorangium cellulosum TaxID=56 RepID=A0A150R4H3_SORCE|nr:hypothetical protein BE17_15250 [Sorangium cellulosum]
MANLGQFLKDMKSGLDPNLGPREVIDRWQPAVEKLMKRVKLALEPYKDDLLIEEWNTAHSEGGIRYNLLALTIRFIDYQITIEPKKAPGRGGPGRVEASCGLNVVWLLWSGGDNWSYKWEYPARSEGPQPLMGDAIERLVEELLR